MTKCCNDEWKTVQNLPFWFSFGLTLDYYDGPTEGIAKCTVCQQSFYYKLLSWDNSTQDDRVFVFYKINITPENIAKSLDFMNTLGTYGGAVPVGKGEEIISIINSQIQGDAVTYICKSDDHFRTGTWVRNSGN